MPVIKIKIKFFSANWLSLKKKEAVFQCCVNKSKQSMWHFKRRRNWSILLAYLNKRLNYYKQVAHSPFSDEISCRVNNCETFCREEKLYFLPFKKKIQRKISPKIPRYSFSSTNPFFAFTLSC